MGKRNYVRWIPKPGSSSGQRIYLDINGEPRSHKARVTKERDGAKRPVRHDRRKQRQVEAAERQAEADKRSRQERVRRLVEAGYGHCREAQTWREMAA